MLLLVSTKIRYFFYKVFYVSGYVLGIIFISLLGFEIDCFAKDNIENQSPRYIALDRIIDQANMYDGKIVKVEGIYFDGFEVTPILAQNIIDHKNGYFILTEPQVRASWRINVPNKVLDQYSTKISGPGGGVRYTKVRIIGIFNKGGIETFFNEYQHDIKICDIAIFDDITGKYIETDQKVLSKECDKIFQNKGTQ